MFKLNAVSQIWKKYIQKLNAWDLSLIVVLLIYITCTFDVLFFLLYDL